MGDYNIEVYLMCVHVDAHGIIIVAMLLENMCVEL